MHDVPYRARDFFKQPLAEQELRELATRAGGIAALFSWRSPSARKLELDPTTAGDEQLLALMLHEPRLIRRPILIAGERMIVGAEPKSLAAAFG